MTDKLDLSAYLSLRCDYVEECKAREELEQALADAHDELDEAYKEMAKLRKDSERLDKIERLEFTRITDSERYLSKQIYFGKGTNKTLRQAIDNFS